MKIFRSNNSEVIAECRRYFQFNLPSELIEKKKLKFERNYNRYCVICVCVSETLLLCTDLSYISFYDDTIIMVNKDFQNVKYPILCSGITESRLLHKTLKR